MTVISQVPDYSLDDSFLESNDATVLFQSLETEVEWDKSIKARMTACYGETYDESGVDYEIKPMHELLNPLCEAIGKRLKFKPTNCLLNYYNDGKSTMGFHSDTISNLENGTGIAIVSLGAERELTFRHIENLDLKHTYLLPHGSLFYMTQDTQRHWKHAVKKAAVDSPRISLTFRRILSEKK